ncbi:RagB/SusD family nutrient uptake outer membrane protein [Sphingobacterium phlebotomi]|uniref:RagB/SusD family nutrient uptake outer membrane protein n=1 Tax=Sphingobacterium phlebotomi TaxID=2605433 RepID=A0A5D4HAU0_9SPHI|nr:RagB/SusD family nutrient uptake outer membrane protein [Sphingobacterium phlebotomi]TYR37323.1 RagB/SusD family nutrient uptake outer membrane protein [Sphingobacterium phlebotomi]
MKMKPIKLMITAALLSICIISCSDFFEVTPESSIQEDDFYKTEADLNASAIGMYESLAKEAHKFLLWGDARADLVTTGQLEPDPYINEFVVNNVSTNNPYTSYAGIYRTIARCNRQMEKVYDVHKLDKNITDRDAGAFYAEALLLRAICYYQLVRTFDEFPLITSDYAEQIRYVNAVGDTITESTLSLTPGQIESILSMPADKQEVWTLIFSDAQTALGLLPINYRWNGGASLSSKERYGRVSQVLAALFAGEIALWLGDYQSASSFCDLPIRNTAYSLGVSGTWMNQFTSTSAANHSMFLLGYEYNQGFETNRLQEFTSSARSDGGKYYLKPATAIVDALYTDNYSDTDADIREQFSYKVLDGDTVIWKYIGLDNVSSRRPPYQSNASWPVLRSADAYLIKALADLRLNNYSSAFNFVNQVREARGLVKLDNLTFPYTDKELMEDMIFAERAREFAFEGRRWYDLMLRSQMNGRNMLADVVAEKYSLEERATIKERLENEANWYIPIDPKLWR